MLKNTKLSKLALFVLAISAPALTACVSTTDSEKSQPSIADLQQLEQLAASEYLNTSASFNAIPLLTKEEMAQPSNLKQECKIPVFSVSEAKAFDRVLWDGQCQNGLANGLGRLIFIKDQKKVSEDLYHFDEQNPNAFATLYLNQLFQDNVPATTTIGKMTYSVQGDLLVPFGLLEIIPNDPSLALTLNLQGNIDPENKDSMQTLSADEVSRMYSVKNTSKLGAISYVYTKTLQAKEENSKNLDTIKLYSLVLRDRDDNSQSYNYIQNAEDTASYLIEGDNEVEISLKQDFADYIDSKLISANKIKAAFVEDALGPRWKDGFTAAYEEYTSKICGKKKVTKFMEDRNYADICAFKPNYLVRAAQIAKLRAEFGEQYNLDAKDPKQDPAQAKAQEDYDFFGSIVLLNRAR